MSTTPAPNDIVLFWYRASPYGRRVAWYLALRNIAYAECRQPPILPRPDLDALGVQYRRSPVMAIGRDIYVDTRLIIAKLEERFPPSAQHPALSTPETAGIAGLLHKLSVENVFSLAARMIPPQAPLLQDEKFIKDRMQFNGGGKSALGNKQIRLDAIVHMRQVFELLELLFVDGRQWVAGTEKPSLADLEGVWPIDWIISDLHPPKEYFSPEIFPKVYDWRKRFRAVLSEATSRAPKAIPLAGEQAVSFITHADFTDKELSVDSVDPTGLQSGTVVEFSPTDGGGFFHKDTGKLVKLTAHEVAITIHAKSGEELRLHAPRWNFKLRPVKGDASRL